jgi:hypothetical protein
MIERLVLAESPDGGRLCRVGGERAARSDPAKFIGYRV